MKGVVCKKLVAKDGKTFRTSAFRVSCCTESADLFYDEALWPSGVELRDWVFYPKTNKKAQLSLTNPRDACEKFARFT